MDNSIFSGSSWFFVAVFIVIVASFLFRRKPSKKRRIGVGQILSMEVEKKRPLAKQQRVTFQVAVEPEPFRTRSRTLSKRKDYRCSSQGLCSLSRTKSSTSTALLPIPELSRVSPLVRLSTRRPNNSSITFGSAMESSTMQP